MPDGYDKAFFGELQPSPAKHYNPYDHLSDEEDGEEAKVRDESGGFSSAVASKAELHPTVHKLHHHHHHSTPAKQSLQQHQHIAAATSHGTAHVIPHQQHGQQNSHHQNGSHGGSNLGMLMLLDGIGLAVITSATIFEGMEMWEDYFGVHWSENPIGLSSWLAGRTCQIIGLLLLIGHASSFQVFPDVERFGMLMLTIGPILNLTCYLVFRAADNPTWWFNRPWLSSETLELIGISILDVSLIDMEEHLVLAAEIVGFSLLCCAAGLHFEYRLEDWLPDISFRLDVTHSSECVGLFMLIIVACIQYRIKVAKHEQEHESRKRKLHLRSADQFDAAV